MGLERTAGVEQLLGLAQGLRRASYDALGLTRHTRRAVRQRPAKPVTRPGTARTSLGVAVTIHDTSLRSSRTRGGVSRRLPGAAKAPDVGSTTLSRRPRSLTNSTTQSQGLIEHLVSVRLRPRACHERQTSPRGWAAIDPSARLKRPDLIARQPRRSTVLERPHGHAIARTMRHVSALAWRRSSSPGPVGSLPCLTLLASRILPIDEASSTGRHRVRGWKISWPA